MSNPQNAVKDMTLSKTFVAKYYDYQYRPREDRIVKSKKEKEAIQKKEKGLSGSPS